MPNALLRGLAIVVVPAFVSLVLQPYAFVVGITGLALAFGAAFFVRPRKAAVIIASLAAVVVASFLPLSLMHSPWNNTEVTVAVEDAHAHPEAALFRFTNARVATEYAVEIAIVGKRVASTRFEQAAPLVPIGWTKSDPVPAWVVAVNNGSPDWTLAHNGGIRMAPLDDCQKAIAKSRSQGLDALADAPILRWSRDPRADKHRDELALLERLAILYALWVLVFAVSHLRKTR